MLQFNYILEHINGRYEYIYNGDVVLVSDDLIDKPSIMLIEEPMDNYHVNIDMIKDLDIQVNTTSNYCNDMFITFKDDTTLKIYYINENDARNIKLKTLVNIL